MGVVRVLEPMILFGKLEAVHRVQSTIKNRPCAAFSSRGSKSKKGLNGLAQLGLWPNTWWTGRRLV